MCQTLRAFFACTLLALLLHGCASVGPDYVPPEMQMPDEWRAAVQQEMEGEESPLETWWTRFEDPVLDRLIEEARARNLDLRIAFARIEEGRAARGIARSDFAPTFNFGAQSEFFQPSDEGVNPAPPGGFSSEQLHQMGIGTAWEIDIFGRVRRQVEAATAGLQATVEDYRDVLVVLYADVAASYVEVRTLQERLEYAHANAKAQRDTVRLTQDRFDAGLTSQRDVVQAQSNLASTLAEIPQFETGLEFALNRLAVLLGEAPGALHDRLLKEGEIPDPDPTLTLGLPADLLRRRPDIRAAERRLAAQTATIGVRTADLYPSFSLTGLLAIQSTSLDSLFGGSSGTWSLIPGLRWNIFSGGKIRNQIRVEEARTEQALLLWEKTVLLALEEVEDALVAYHREKIRRQRLREGVEASSKAVELVRTQYMAGLTDFVSYLDSQRALFRQQDQLAESEGQVVQNLIQLNRALGGGWASGMAGPSYVTWKGTTPPPEDLIEGAVTPKK